MAKRVVLAAIKGQVCRSSRAGGRGTCPKAGEEAQDGYRGIEVQAGGEGYCG